MSGGSTAVVHSMKTASAFAQSNPHVSVQHAQPPAAVLQPTTLLQSSNGFTQQMHQQQQHLIQQQRAQIHNAQQLHRISQPPALPSVHSAQSAVLGNNAHSNVFPNADFFQTLQQTAAAAALPTVLPYDQSQYIGPLMYFPYPTAAATNGIFASSSVADPQSNSISTGSVTTINSTSNSAANHVLTASATPGAMVTLNHSHSTGQIPANNHLLVPGSGLVGLGNNSISASLAPASLTPLFTSTQFYSQAALDPNGNSLQAVPQSQHSHTLQVAQQLHSLPVHSSVHMQPSSTATTVLFPGQVSHSTFPQFNTVGSPANVQRLTNSVSSNTDGSSTPINSTATKCELLSKTDEPSGKSTDSDIACRNSQLGQSMNTECTPSVKRDNNGTGHFVCTVCGREFGMRCRLIAHTRRHTGERPFPCADCGRAFSDRGNLQRHRYTHSSQPRFHCSVCGKSFRQASCLSNHRRFHCAGATGRPCPFCQRSFRSSSSLQMHIRWKHRADAAAAVAAAAAASAAAGNSEAPIAYQLPNLASYIPTSCMQNGILGMGLNGVSSDLQNSSLLSAAAAVAASAAIMNNGSLSSSSAVSMMSTNSLCLNCTAADSSGTPIASVQSTVVASNAMINSPNKRKWRRKQKPKHNAFGRLAGDGVNILAGINLSEGIDVNAAAAAAGAAAAAVGGPVPLDRKGRPCNFPCPACPRRFAFQCRLAAHLRCHTNIRPFTCTDCGRAFTQRGYLVRHAAVHKLDRPFTCGLCDRSYKHYGSLVNHKRTHNKLNASVLGNLGLLSPTNLHQQLNCNSSVTPVTGLSGLEGMMTGQMNKPDQPNNTTSSAAAATITLLPVSKVEEVLPNDLGQSVHQLCLPSFSCPSANLFAIPDSRNQTDPDSQIQNQPHQLTATAVWPILASQHPGTAHVQMPAQFTTNPHFPTIAFPQHLTGQAFNHPNHQQFSFLSAQRQHQSIQPTNSSVNAATFVTVPIFSNHNQSETGVADTSASVSSHQNAFTESLVSTALDPGSSSHMQHQESNHLYTNSAQQSAISGDVNTTSMFHVLQPSPSIFFSPYYLPHSTASSQM